MDQPPPQLPAPPSLPQRAKPPAVPQRAAPPPPPLPARVERPPGKCHFCQEVLHYASVGAKPTFIANYLKISRRKILLYCRRELRAGWAKYHLALRGYQVDVAKKGSVNILIHLGKTELGQVPKEIEERPIPEPRYRP